MSVEAVSRAAGVPVERWVDASEYAPRYNAAPGAVLPVLRLAPPATDATEARERDDEATDAPDAPDTPRERQLQSMRWGLVPSWTKRDETPDYWRMFNARADTAGEKAVFSRLLARRRCVVLLNGFYEWHSEGSKAAGFVKQPYYLHAEGEADDTPLRAAGLYDKWVGPDDSDKPVYTCTILTTDASPQLRWLHDRMPVFLRSEADERAWLGQGGDASPLAVLRDVSRPEAGPPLAWHPVSTRLNKAGEAEGPECCAPAPRAAERDAGSVAALFARSAAAGASAQRTKGDGVDGEADQQAQPPIRAGGDEPAAGTPGKRRAQDGAPPQPSPASQAKRAKHATPQKGQRSVASFFGGK